MPVEAMEGAAVSDPRVLCVMPAAGRQLLVNRAVQCFHAQTYPARTLVVLDNGPEPLTVPDGPGNVVLTRLDVNLQGRPIGALRNIINGFSSPNVMDAEIIVHWDSDDWSHPFRVHEQVALLETTKAAAVGYNQMLFWWTAQAQFLDLDILPTATMWHGEAWMYSQPNRRLVPGTTLCYWRKTWEKKPFPEKNTGEDTEWLLKVKAESISSIPAPAAFALTAEPRVIAEIHGENTCSAVEIGKSEWERAARWDKYCSRTMTRC